jgi:hypothetical protein
MNELERSLAALAAEIAWPETPDLASRLELAPQPRPLLTPRRRRALALAFALLVLALGVAFAVPQARTAILRFFHLRGATVEVVKTLPPAQERALTADLGAPITADDVERELGFRPLLPRGLGAPTVYYDAFPPGGQLGLVYAHGLVVTQVEGHLSTYIRKFLPPGTTMERLTIDGERALWISGELHQYAYVDKTGQIVSDSVRTAGDVLLWRHRDLLVRIEGARSKRQAAAIVRSAREAP